MVNNQISVTELMQCLNDQQDIFLLDVRTREEYALFNLGGHLIPLAELGTRWQEVPTTRWIVVYCRSGCRSLSATEFLQHQGYEKVSNLTGGILAWQSAQCRFPSTAGSKGSSG